MGSMVQANPLPSLRVAMLLPGLGRVQRGAETAFRELAKGLARFEDVDVTLFGSGPDTPDGVRAVDVGCVPRERFERWPAMPVLRNEYCYEELSFILSLISRRLFRPRDFDVAVHCTFPFTNWFLRQAERRGGPKSLFVTENGDWMCRAESREYRTFSCSGLVCTNPEYFERHKTRYPTRLIPNGVDPQVYHPAAGRPEPTDPRIPETARVVLMSSALIETKRVADGVRAVAGVPDAFLVVAGDGPERDAVRELAGRLLPGRHLLLGAIPRGAMPALYRRASAFLHMSQIEPGCISYVEAAATGLPVVAHDSPVTRWTFGGAAVLVDTSDVPAVADGVRRALTEQAAALGTAARRHVVAEWSWAALAARYRDFMHTLLATKRQQVATCSR